MSQLLLGVGKRNDDPFEQSGFMSRKEAGNIVVEHLLIIQIYIYIITVTKVLHCTKFWGHSSGKCLRFIYNLTCEKCPKKTKKQRGQRCSHIHRERNRFQTAAYS